jgi:hypothetical protein
LDRATGAYRPLFTDGEKSSAGCRKEKQSKAKTLEDYPPYLFEIALFLKVVIPCRVCMLFILFFVYVLDGNTSIT